jgi:competence protein ComEA
MTTGRIINGWVIIAIVLAVVIIAGGVVIWSKGGRSQAIEISVVNESELSGEIYVGGAVSNPGFYPLEVGDSIEDVLRVVGGPTDNADLSQLKLIVPNLNEGEPPQKVNINRAETWLLAALPGIGDVRAQAIIDYRQQNGPFRNINELTDVEGIGVATFENIKHLITVNDGY